jgi:endonuclease/exonuclease/phosphatase family metal-dependent hydrolase
VVAADPPVPDGAAGSNELIVVTWNVHAGGGDILDLVDELRAARSINPPRPGSTPLDIVDIAARLRLALFYVPSMRNGAPHETDGNAILSTEPLSELSVIELPFERQRRVAVEATVQGWREDGESWTLRLTNAHLENLGGPWRVGILSMAARLKQVRHLLRETPASGPAILGGDLNTWLGFGEPAYRALTKVFTGEARSDPRPTFGRLLRLDHLLFRLPDDRTRSCRGAWSSSPMSQDIS